MTPCPPAKKQPKKTDPRHAWFIRWFAWAACQLSGSAYLVTKKDAGIVKQLLTIGLDDLCARACCYLLLDDERRFPRGSPTLSGLCLMVNELSGRYDNATDARAVALGIFPPAGTKLKDFTPWRTYEDRKFQAA